MDQLRQTTIRQDAQHPASAPMPLAQLQHALRAIFDSGASWLMVFDDAAKSFVDGLSIGYGVTGSDFKVFACQLPDGTMIGIAALAKARLSARQLSWQLRKIGIEMSVSEAGERDLLILAAGANLDTATILMDQLLSYGRAANCPTVPMSSLTTIDARAPFSWASMN